MICIITFASFFSLSITACAECNKGRPLPPASYKLIMNYKIREDLSISKNLYGYYEIKDDIIDICVAGMEKEKLAKMKWQINNKVRYPFVIMLFEKGFGICAYGAGASCRLDEAMTTRIVNNVYYDDDNIFHINIKRNTTYYSKIIKILSNSEKAYISFGNAKESHFSYYDDKAHYCIAFSEKVKQIDSLKISSLSDKTYTGSEITPKITIRNGSKELICNKDYTLTLKNNINIGTAEVTITGIGNYTGATTKTFKIIPKKTALKVTKDNDTFRFRWNAVSGIDKYQIWYSEDGSNFMCLGTVDASKTELSYSKLDTNNSYTFKIRSYKTIDGKTYFSEFSKEVTV